MIEDWLENAYEGMSRRRFMAQMAVAGTVISGFAAAATPVAGEIIRTSSDGLKTYEGLLPAGDFSIPCYEASPSATGRYPAVIVLPEIFGMHEYIKDVVRRFAVQGFYAVTFEPYARQGGVQHLSDIAAVRKVVDEVPDQMVLQDIDSVFSHIKGKPSVCPGIGITGFCRGGMYALLYAARNKEINSVVSWYGQLKPVIKHGIRTEGPFDVASKIRVPILGLYGAEDLGIPAADAEAMETALRKAGANAEFVVYPKAPHAFHADYRPSYRPEAAKDAWGRCVRHFRKTLTGC